MYIWIILMLLGVFLDQISKYLIVINLEFEQSVDIIPGVFRFTYIKNTGAAFGMMGEEGSRWIFMVLSTVMIVGILIYIFWKKPKSLLLMSALTLIVAGGVGNMIDRVRLGYVVDFLDFYAFPNVWKWVFNVADACVCIGAGVMILWMILDLVREQKKAKAAAALAEGMSEEEMEAQALTEPSQQLSQENTELPEDEANETEATAESENEKDEANE